MWRRRMSSVSTHNTDIPREVNQQNNYIVISSDKEENDDRSSLSEDEWYINCILDETESQYLIDWEGPWSPSWEPKEHASESAIQAWEEKKQIHSVNKTQNTEISETPTGVKDTQDHSVESTDSAEHLAQQRGDSPLFIPSDSLAGSVLFLRNDRWSEIPESGQVTPTTPEIPESAPWCSDPAVPLTSAVTPSGATCVFEYTSTTPIPLEYLLPSEIEGYLATQETGSSRLPLTTAAGETPESDDLLTPEAAKRSQLPHSAVSAITQDTPRDPVHPRHSELDGVAETPPISLTVSESQYSLQRSATSNPQKTLTPIGRCSGYSSLVSQLLASKSPSSGPPFRGFLDGSYANPMNRLHTSSSGFRGARVIVEYATAFNEPS
ncbi:hypothetical protein BDV25DRAFT_140153 [Aspergillus avenaceus]|uniref:Chromo domain-containing protein n=1 Tax=Aspergillus avenaceus TaxID=36643 RepID=A0A5N6TUQ6_ASPAV|nr:hypothetical protein BDV25DRAFT_140153 [Aspergillus avenaceus]